MSINKELISLIAAIVLNFALSTSGETQQLSEQSEIILMSMSPSQDEVFTAFGHSAIRVKDEPNRIDMVFNYGIFDFDQPYFYLNFTKGKLYYKLGVSRYNSLLQYYMRDNRTITEQSLNLSTTEKQKVFDVLMENAKPENANYYYNYCYNNCATKIRDVMQGVLGNQLHFDFSYANDSLSYRDLMDKYLEQQPWGDLAIDFCLGSEIDQLADGSAYTYMPEYLNKAFTNATIVAGDSTRSLIKETNTMNTEVPMPDAASLIKPLHVFIGLFFIIGLMTHRSLKYEVQYKLLDVLLFGITGFLGCSLLLLWLGTDHLSAYNYNLIWCNPLNLAALILFLNRKNDLVLKYYLLLYGIALVLLIVFREFLMQEVHIAFIPLLLGLALRSFFLYSSLKKVES